jgi:nucleolar complex protein 2
MAAPPCVHCHSANAPAHRQLPAPLQSTDQELLNFGKDSDEDLDSEEEGEGGDGDLMASDDEQHAGVSGTAAAGKQQQRSGITLHMVEGWCQAARDKASMGAVRNIMKVSALMPACKADSCSALPFHSPPCFLCLQAQAYRVACHYGDSEEKVEEGMQIASSAVYNKLMLFVLVSGDCRVLAQPAAEWFRFQYEDCSIPRISQAPLVHASTAC